MIKSKFIFRRNLLICSSLILLIITGHFFIDSNTLASLLWPAFGFAAMYYYFYRKESLPAIIIGILFGQLISELLFGGTISLSSIVMRFGFSLTTIIEVIVLVHILDKFIHHQTTNFVKINIFFFGGLASVVLGGLLISLFELLLVPETIDYLYVLQRWIIGDFSGYIIFGSLLYFSITRKEHIKHLKYHSIGYLIVFVALTIVLFSFENEWYSYHNLGYILVLMYTVGAVMYSYSIIIINNVLLLLTFEFIYLNRTSLDINVDSLADLVFSLNLLLFAVSMVSLIIRYYYEKTLEQTNQIKSQNDDLQEMINSTHKFISLSGKLLGSSKNLNTNYLKEIFNISCVIFSNYDSGSCFIVEDGIIQFIDAITYDVAELNKLKIKEAKFSWTDSTQIIHNKRAESTIQDRLKNEYEHYSNIVPEIKESIYLYFQLSDGIRGGISFDIFEASNNSFSEADFEIYKAFHNLVYSIYQNAIYTTERDAFKSDIVWSLMKTLNYYDEYTVGHSQDVAEIALEIAKRLDLSEDAQFDTYWAGVVHDIGKIGIPNEIINKPSRLTKEEYEKVKTHPLIAYDILRVNKDLSRIADIVKAHHERPDGLGYPDQTKKDNIPFEAQILSVADSVSSMGSNRPYSSPMTESEIIAELLANTDTQFHPEVVNVMIKLIKEGWIKINTTLFKYTNDSN